MKLREYMDEAKQYVVFPDKHYQLYLHAAWYGELGEALNICAKVLRGDFPWSPEVYARIANEIGDMLWYLFMWVHRARRDLAINEVVLDFDFAYYTEECKDLPVNPTRATEALLHLIYDFALWTEPTPDPQVRTLAYVARQFGHNLNTIAQANLEKLAKRQANDQIHDRGGER